MSVHNLTTIHLIVTETFQLNPKTAESWGPQRKYQGIIQINMNHHVGNVWAKPVAFIQRFSRWDYKSEQKLRLAMDFPGSVGPEEAGEEECIHCLTKLYE